MTITLLLLLLSIVWRLLTLLVHASIIHWTLTWTTGSLTCACNIFAFLCTRQPIRRRDDCDRCFWVMHIHEKKMKKKKKKKREKNVKRKSKNGCWWSDWLLVSNTCDCKTHSCLAKVELEARICRFYIDIRSCFWHPVWLKLTDAFLCGQVGELVSFLCSSVANQMTGSSVVIDGAWTAKWNGARTDKAKWQTQDRETERDFARVVE